MEYLQFIKPELLILIPVLYFIGMWLKNSKKVLDWTIPFVLSGLGIVLTLAYLLSVEFSSVGSLPASYIFTSFVQGILCAAGAVYTDNAVKQVTTNRLQDGVK